jgi:hypothetical protein
VKIAVGLTISASAPATESQAIALRRVIANQTGVAESAIEDFLVGTMPAPTSAPTTSLVPTATPAPTDCLWGVDCFGVCGGKALEDQCGVCNGNNDCLVQRRLTGSSPPPGGVAWGISFTVSTRLSTVAESSAGDFGGTIADALGSKAFADALAVTDGLDDGGVAVLPSSISAVVAATRRPSASPTPRPTPPCADVASFCALVVQGNAGACAKEFCDDEGCPFAHACDVTCALCPSDKAAAVPTPLPSALPSGAPSPDPTPIPTEPPSGAPSPVPSPLPSVTPTLYPTPACNGSNAGLFNLYLTDRERSGVRVAFSIVDQDDNDKVVSNGTFSGAMAVEKRVLCLSEGCYSAHLAALDGDNGDGSGSSSSGSSGSNSRPWAMRDAADRAIESVVNAPSPQAFCASAEGTFDAAPSSEPTLSPAPTALPTPAPTFVPSPRPTGGPSLPPTPSCASGEFLEARTGLCQTCPTGKFSNNQSGVWQFSCEACPVGSISAEDKSRCIQVRHLK